MRGCFIGQVTLHLDDETMARLRSAARDAGVSMSSWLAQRVRERTSDRWPTSVADLAGAWDDFPEPEALRAPLAADVDREPL